MLIDAAQFWVYFLVGFPAACAAGGKCLCVCYAERTIASKLWFFTGVVIIIYQFSWNTLYHKAMIGFWVDRCLVRGHWDKTSSRCTYLVMIKCLNVSVTPNAVFLKKILFPLFPFSHVHIPWGHAVGDVCSLLKVINKKDENTRVCIIIHQGNLN